jgi:hypothetical protein
MTDEDPTQVRVVVGPMSRPLMLLCADPIAQREPDAAFAAEAGIAEFCGFRTALLDHDALERHGNAEAALRRSKIDEAGPAAYRGWMVRADAYRSLHEALSRRGIRLIDDPAQYAACHHLPEAHAHLGRWMARTTWVRLDRLDDPAALDAALAPFGHGPVVIRDWVKSQAAGYWAEACFIPDASDRAEVKRVLDRFRDLQGGALTGGIVFRAYEALERAGDEVEEWRAVILDGTVLGCWPRFPGTGGAPPPRDLLDPVARAVPGRFATADFARRASGGWLLVEAGAGEVSSFPPGADVPAILTALAASL